MRDIEVLALLRLAGLRVWGRGHGCQEDTARNLEQQTANTSTTVHTDSTNTATHTTAHTANTSTTAHNTRTTTHTHLNHNENKYKH